MPPAAEVILVGGFIEIIELCQLNDISIAGIIDRSGQDMHTGISVLGTDEDAALIFSDLQWKHIPVVITPDIPGIREKLVAQYRRIDVHFASIVSQRALISSSTTIGKGTIIQSLVNISSQVSIGDFVKVNTAANIMHDSHIGDFTTIAPNAVILGRIHIGQRCYIGANATILPDRKITDDVVVGAGAVVTKDINVPGIYVGNPARLLEK